MKVLIIGGVAAGTKVAAKLKRENRRAYWICEERKTSINLYEREKSLYASKPFKAIGLH